MFDDYIMFRANKSTSAQLHAIERKIAFLEMKMKRDAFLPISFEERAHLNLLYRRMLSKKTYLFLLSSKVNCTARNE
jgi:hypothetical protein